MPDHVRMPVAIIPPKDQRPELHRYLKGKSAP